MCYLPRAWVVGFAGGMALHLAKKPVVAATTDRPTITKSVIAGPGLVEPDSEDVKVGSELAGKLKEVLAEEGQQVKKGQLLAMLVNDDYRAQVEASRAQVHQAQAALDKILNGSRAQERKEVFAGMQQAEAVEANAKSDLDRRKKLFDAGVISREEMDHSRRDFNVAEAAVRRSRRALSSGGCRQRDEDIAAAGHSLRWPGATGWE